MIIRLFESVDKARVPNLTIQILKTESNSYYQRTVAGFTNNMQTHNCWNKEEEKLKF